MKNLSVLRVPVNPPPPALHWFRMAVLAGYFLLMNPRLQINSYITYLTNIWVQNRTKTTWKVEFSSSLSPPVCGRGSKKWAWSNICTHAHPSNEPPPRKSWICPCLTLGVKSSTNLLSSAPPSVCSTNRHMELASTTITFQPQAIRHCTLQFNKSLASILNHSKL